MAHHPFQAGGPGHCQLFVSYFRPLINHEENETDGAALTARLSSCLRNRPDKSPRTHLYGHALNGRCWNHAPLRRRPFMPLPTRSVPLPVSERPLSASAFTLQCVRSETFSRAWFHAAFWNWKPFSLV